MAKLDLYNGALTLLGLRKLATITDDTESRYMLDGVYTRQGIEYCLQLVKPNFACKTVMLEGTAATNTYEWSFELPEDSIDSVGYWTDIKLSQPLTRYIEDGATLECDFSQVWNRYVSSENAEEYDMYPASFARVVEAYLALECSTRLSPEDYAKLQGKLEERITISKGLDGVGNWAGTDSPAGSTSSPVTTLTTPWVNIYNDAFLILGLNEIVSGTDDSDRRVKMDRVLSAGLVADILDETGWQFGQTTSRIYYDPSAEPAFGHRYAIPKPIDLHYIYGVFVDEMKTTPLKDYEDEGQYLFCEYQDVFMTYITTTFLANPSNWPTYFKRVIAARMAKDAAASLGADPTARLSVGDMIARADDAYRERKSSAMSTDAMQSPPRRISDGSWTRSRWNGRSNGRP